MDIGPDKERIDKTPDDPEWKDLLSDIAENSRYYNAELEIGLFNEICAKGPSAWQTDVEKAVLIKNFKDFAAPCEYEALAVCCFIALSRAKEMKTLLETRLGVRIRLDALFEAANPEGIYLEFEVAHMYISVAINTLGFSFSPKIPAYSVTDFTNSKFPDPLDPVFESNSVLDVIAFLEEYLPIIAPTETPWPEVPEEWTDSE